MITFKHTDADSEVAVDVFKHTQWPSLVVTFLQFLRGCGYCLSTAEFYEYLADQIEQYEDAEK